MISEKFSKNGRGRPRLMSKEVEVGFRQLYPELGRRALQNAYYAAGAFGFVREYLDKKPEMEWLIETNDRGNFRRGTLLAELGRLFEYCDPETASYAINWLCERKPKVKEGVAVLRRLRLGEPKPAEDGLIYEIIAAINSYLSRYPSTTRDDVLEALEIASVAIEFEKG